MLMIDIWISSDQLTLLTSTKKPLGFNFVYCEATALFREVSQMPVSLGVGVIWS